MDGMDFESNAVGPVERQTLGDKIYELLRRAIISGDLKPGQRVTERELAQQMNVSTTPVREAFRRLSAIGLITIIPWSGAVIEGISRENIIEVAQCREVLEGLACRLATQQIDAEGLRRLEILVNQAVSEPDAKRIFEMDSEIHQLIVDYSGNHRLAGMLSGLNEIARFYRDLRTSDMLRVQEMCNEYKEILAAMSSGDAEQAESVMRKHVCNSLGTAHGG